MGKQEKEETMACAHVGANNELGYINILCSTIYAEQFCILRLIDELKRFLCRFYSEWIVNQLL